MKPENAAMENDSVSHQSRNNQHHFTTGSEAHTEPLFCLVECMILSLPWPLKKHLDAVSDENLDGKSFQSVGIVIMFFTGFEKKERVAKYGDLYLCYGIEGGKEHWSFTPRTRQLLPDLR